MDEQNPIIDITSEPSMKASAGSGQYAARGLPPPPPLESLLRRRRFAFLGMLALLLAAFLVWAWIRPRSFRATGTILVTRLGQVPAPVTEAELASEVEMIRLQVSELTTGIGGSSRVAESMQAAEVRRLKLKSKVEVTVLDHSQVIQVAFTDASRKTASDSVNLLMDLYLQQRYRMFSSPSHMVNVEAEGLSLQSRADQALLELRDFDRQKNAALARDEHQLQNQHRGSIESRLVDVRTSIRGQEEILRVLRLRTGGDGTETIRAEAQLAGLKAQLIELEKSSTAAAKAGLQTGVVALEREELKAKADRALERAEQMTRKLQDVRVSGSALQARILTRAEPAPVQTFDLPWWMFLVLGLGACFAAWLGAWAWDLVDRPIYDDEDFANLTGAPPMKSRSAAAGK